ncbi:hypothetical protein TKK_0000304 [Trichogramma kaykai]
MRRQTYSEEDYQREKQRQRRIMEWKIIEQERLEHEKLKQMKIEEGFSQNQKNVQDDKSNQRSSGVSEDSLSNIKITIHRKLTSEKE